MNDYESKTKYTDINPGFLKSLYFQNTLNCINIAKIVYLLLVLNIHCIQIQGNNNKLIYFIFLQQVQMKHF